MVLFVWKLEEIIKKLDIQLSESEMHFAIIATIIWISKNY